MRPNSENSQGAGVVQPNAWLYLEEITHRALNDYTAMLAIVRRAAEAAPDQASAQALNDVSLRLRASAMTYLALRPPHDCSVRDLSQELASLCTAMSNSVLSTRDISLTLSSDPVTISAFRCWQISLVVSELVTNAARHAFGRHRSGSVTVKVCAGSETLQCAIIDDGAGGEFSSPGRGTMIVDSLINELGGTITRDYAPAGSTIFFSVPLAEAVFLPRLAAPQRIAPGKPLFGILRLKDQSDRG